MAQQDNDEKVEVQALCPDCGSGFTAYVERIMPDVHASPQKVPAACPHCGCRDCVIK